MAATNNSLPQWVDRALEHQLLAQADVMHWLLQSAQQSLPLPQYLTSCIVGHPNQSKLQQLIDQSRPLSATQLTETPAPDSTMISAASPPGSQPSDIDATCIGGKSNGTRSARPSDSQQDSAFSAGQHSQSSSRSFIRTPDQQTHWRSRTRALQSGFDRYQIRQEIGRGGCGVVSTAFDTQLQRLVVIKQILADAASNESATRFLNEAQITGQLLHPGIVPVYEMGQDRDGLPFYVMKYLDGQTLSQSISQFRNLPNGSLKQAELHHLLGRFLDVCQTLAYAHQCGVIHRDLKPANVMIGQFGETIVLDWGLARRVSDSGSQVSENQEQTVTIAAGSAPVLHRTATTATEATTDTANAELSQSDSQSLTQQGAVLGTAAYMSPEQARGANSTLDQRSDVFSLGVILYELLSGVSPFRGDTLANTIDNVATCCYKPLLKVQKSVPRPLAAICSRAMSADPAYRYEDASQLAQDLASYLAGQPVVAYQEKWYERLDRIAERHRTLFRSVFAATILIALLGSISTGIISRAHQSEKWAKEQAVAANLEANQALKLEREASRFANQQLSTARLAADNWLIQLSGDLEFYPGLTPLRDNLIRQGMQHYETLIQQTRQSLKEYPDLGQEPRQLELARNMIRVGDLRRLADSTESALQPYEDATKILQQLQQSSTTMVAPLREQIDLEFANAQLGIAMSLSDPEKAREVIDQTHQSLTKSLTESPNDLRIRNALVRCRLIYARLIGEDQPVQAQSWLQKGLADVEPLTQQSDRPEYRKLKENLLRDMAQLQYRQSDWSAAEQTFSELLEHLQNLPAQLQQRPDIQESFSWTRSFLSNCAQRTGRLRESLVLSDQSQLDLQSAWDQLYAEPFYRENQAILEFNRARMLQRVGRVKEAVQSAQSAVQHMRSVFQSREPTHQRIASMARMYLLLSDLLLSSDADTATQWHQQAQILIEHLQSDPSQTSLASVLKLLSQLPWAEQELLSQLTTDTESIVFHETVDGSADIDDAGLKQRVARLQTWQKILRDPQQAENEIQQYHQQFGWHLPEKSTADQDVQWLRTALEWNYWSSKVDARINQLSQEVLKRYPESSEAWEAVFLTAIVIGDRPTAQRAWDRVKWCRAELEPHHELFQLLADQNWNGFQQAMTSFQADNPRNRWRLVLAGIAQNRVATRSEP